MAEKIGVRTAIVCEGAPVPLLILVLSVRSPFFGLVGGHLPLLRVTGYRLLPLVTQT